MLKDHKLLTNKNIPLSIQYISISSTREKTKTKKKNLLIMLYRLLLYSANLKQQHISKT